MTGRNRVLKRKLRAGYRALSLQCTSYFSSSSVVVSRAFSALCVCSKFGHHPPSLGYLCAKFRLFHGLHCWASLWRKIAYSLIQSPCLFDAPGTEAFASEYCRHLLAYVCYQQHWSKHHKLRFLTTLELVQFHLYIPLRDIFTHSSSNSSSNSSRVQHPTWHISVHFTSKPYIHSINSQTLIITIIN